MYVASILVRPHYIAISTLLIWKYGLLIILMTPYHSFEQIEQMKMGDKVRVRSNPNKNHFLSRIDEGREKNIAYWSGANGCGTCKISDSIYGGYKGSGT
jgi:hypothetical protein